MRQRNFKIVLAGALVLLSQGIALAVAGASSAMAATSTPTAHASTMVPRSVPDDTYNVKVCEYDHQSLCANVKNNDNTVGENVWLWGPAGGDAQWNIIVDANCALGITCYYIKDAQDTALCMAATGTGGNYVELQRCSETGAWYSEGNWIIGNANYGANGTLQATAAAFGGYLYTYRSGSLQRWLIPGIN